MCSWLALAACFSLNGLYVDYGAVWLKKYEREFDVTVTRLTAFTDAGAFNREYINSVLDSPDRLIKNPYGALSVGYEMDFSSYRIDAQLFHMESTSHDRGDTGAKINVRWFPFR